MKGQAFLFHLSSRWGGGFLFAIFHLPMVISHCRKTAAHRRQWSMTNPKWKIENEPRLHGETFAWALIFLLLPLSISAQTPPPSPPPAPPPTTVSIASPTTPAGIAWTGKRGSLTGRIVSDDGQPFANIGVSVFSVAAERSARRMATTDDEGTFKASDLPSGAYRVSTFAPGYVTSESTSSDSLLRPTNYRLGENATITLVKGGVITGKALDSSGQPLVAAVVLAHRVRDGEGRPVNSVGSFGSRGITDDRGVYRIFGLPSGSYIVATDGSGEATTSAREVMTYYPTATRDTAQEVVVTVGTEVQGIDIRHRGEVGHVVSGTVSGFVESRSVFSAGVSVELLQLATGVRVANTSLSSAGGNGFAMYGVPDGEYEVMAYQQSFSADTVASQGLSVPRRVTVKGNDVTGIELRVSGLGAIDGRLVVEKFDAPATCQIKRRGAVEETLISVRRDEKETRLPRFTFAEALPDEKGDFALRGLVAGLYRINSQLPSDHWYVKAMTLPGVAAPTRTPVPRTAPPKVTTINAATGVTIKGNEKLSGFTVTLAEGAAGLTGRVAGDKPPSRLRVLMLPAEKEAAENVVRYYEVVARGGSFACSHLAPGKYWLLTRAVAEDESEEKLAKPLAWDAGERAKLRREAEAANQAVDLTACQRVKDYVLQK